jgi:heme exporter protein B
MAMVNATTGIFTGAFDPAIWIKLLVAYDIIYTTVSLLLFDTILRAE